jgi:thiamine-phosphate pyrophosphorylase
MRGLYAIVDVEALSPFGLEPLPFARAILGTRPAALQLRAKEVSARESLALLRALAPMCRVAGVPLVANDRADLAALAGCDLVHLGQDDVPVALARRIAPGLGVGISTHTPAQLTRALELRPAYVAYGPVYPTSSKRNPGPLVGVSGLRDAAREAAAAGIPLVAIGGIDLEHAVEVGSLADAGAVIRGLLDGVTDLREAAERARLLHEALGGGPACAGATA